MEHRLPYKKVMLRNNLIHLFLILIVNNGTGFAVGSIYDKLGIPTQVDDITINALPLRAYNLIYKPHIVTGKHFVTGKRFPVTICRYRDWETLRDWETVSQS